MRRPEISGPALRWVCRLSDRPGVSVRPEAFWDRIQTADSFAVIRALAAVNVGLEIDRLESSTQRAAAERYIRPEYRPLGARTTEHRTEGAFFARSSALVATLDPLNLLFDGIPLTDFAAVAFGLYAHAHARAGQADALCGEECGCLIDSSSFLSQNVAIADNIGQVLTRAQPQFREIPRTDNGR
jgi:hypothetical protein